MKAEDRAPGRPGQGGKPPRPRKWLARVGDRLCAHVREVVMRKDLVDEGEVPRKRLRLVEADRPRVRELCRRDAHLRQGREKCLSYLDNGFRGLLAEVDGRLVGHVWWCDPRRGGTRVHPHLVRYGLALEPGEVWGFDLYLMPEHRGGGMSNDFFALFRRFLREAGYARVYGAVDAANLPAVWLHKVQGYVPVKTVEGTLFGGVLLSSGGRLFLKNPRFGAKQRFDFRALR